MGVWYQTHLDHGHTFLGMIDIGVDIKQDSQTLLMLISDSFTRLSPPYPQFCFSIISQKLELPLTTCSCHH